MCAFEFWLVTKADEELLIVACARGLIFVGFHIEEERRSGEI